MQIKCIVTVIQEGGYTADMFPSVPDGLPGMSEEVASDAGGEEVLALLLA